MKLKCRTTLDDIPDIIKAVCALSMLSVGLWMSLLNSRKVFKCWTCTPSWRFTQQLWINCSPIALPNSLLISWRPWWYRIFLLVEATDVRTKKQSWWTGCTFLRTLKVNTISLLHDLLANYRYVCACALNRITLMLFPRILANDVEINLSQVLSFVTGSSTIPPMGFPGPICISFIEDREATLPVASTCSMTLRLPVILVDTAEFKQKIVYDIANTIGFGQV